MPPSDDVRLQHMLDAARRAIEFVQQRTRDDLDADDMLTLALVRLLEILGEAAKNGASTLKEKHPSMPWQQMAQTRDRLSHGYYDVDLDIIWRIITVNLPPLVAQLESILAEDRTQEER